ncbi:hypothetical protein [Mycolicibacterium aubagnense]|uniref:Uncharacterized protein n=1 Tax=Mycolicibacterium aubagnense TaxID=319707 RepID=A0ABM7IMQ9_9MYCO|nr:hypothetical protein [Mycolicibacterium aubagnense]TLH48542.1 hypothetical protein C1S80_29955 [Mycolicibacterium aubagnense]BBX88010.1 hypothetical protein MAUB_58830 [Mycolicibacterium aubagnense]
MSHTEHVNPADLREGDMIDLQPLLALVDDSSVHPWVWQPFGGDDRTNAAAIETARIASESELAVVESVEAIADGTVVVYNDQINITMRANLRVARTVG